MKRMYKPNLGGFDAHLGLRNGLEELLRQPVPEQDVVFYTADDISSDAGKPRPAMPYRRRGRYRRIGK